jgi:hypothetical protein
VVECLSSKHEALISNPSIAKKKKKDSTQEQREQTASWFDFSLACANDWYLRW